MPIFIVNVAMTVYPTSMLHISLERYFHEASARFYLNIYAKIVDNILNKKLKFAIFGNEF